MLTRRPEPERPPRQKLDHLVAIAVTKETPKEQIPFIKGWNAMRQRLLELGEMESE